MQQFSETAQYTLRFINQTQRSLFLTGKAGTGKTTLLREIIRTTHKNTVVVAPTGIAALNAGGVTIHSMFQLPFAAFIPDDFAEFSVGEYVKFESRNSLRRHFKMNKFKQQVIRSMELLVIDEVSMLRADLLDAIDFMLQSVRRISKPFGGVQVLFIGDLQQLPPVVKDEEWKVLRNYYNGKFFFHSHVLQMFPPLYIELTKIYRQTDEQFISVLNNLRNNQLFPEDIQLLNQYVKPDFDFKANPGYITLTTHNAKADHINSDSLNELKGKSVKFKAEIVDDFPEKMYPIDSVLELKVGAQVMFIKNDWSGEKQFFNGKMGVIDSLSDGEIMVRFPEEKKTIEVVRYEWENIRYVVDENTREIKEEVLGTFTHYPIKLAWAITVHKSQGLTFDKAAIDVSHVFLPGQAYVALSRLRSLNGLVLLSQLKMNGLSNDQDVMDFSKTKSEKEILDEVLQLETRNFALNYLKNCFDWIELVSQWRNMVLSFQNESEKSPKSKFKSWAEEQANAVSELLNPSQKFLSQIHKILMSEKPDFDFASERIQAAVQYFLPKLDAVVGEALLKIEQVIRTKKSKAFYEELQELEEISTDAVLRLMKAELLVKALKENLEISKENLHSETIQNYRKNKVAEAGKLYREKFGSFVEEDSETIGYASKKNAKAEPKHSTHEITLELWKKQYSVEDISVERKLTISTINGHLVKLISEGKINISEIFPQDKIDELAILFKDSEDSTLGDIKEKSGDSFTWDELKMFRVSLK